MTEGQVRPMLQTMLSIVLNMHEESGQVDGFGGGNIAGEIIAEILDSELELPGQVVPGPHDRTAPVHTVPAPHPHLVVTRLVILYR